MLTTVQMYTQDFLSLFYPRLCNGCRKALIRGEECICTFCRHALPQTGHHRDRDNPVSRIFWGRIEVETATALLYFQKGSTVQNLIHQFKYRGKTEIGMYLGKMLGNKIKDHPLWEPVNYIVPVPLHEKKKYKRGFNQSEVFGKGLARAMERPLLARNLVRIASTTTQTRKTRFKRWKNVETVFRIQSPEKLRGKNILLVDDVVTTGSTLEACAQKLKEVPGVKIWMATIAMSI